MEVIRLDNVSLTYDGDIRVDVLRNIDLQINRGEFVGIIGDSGAGKSSLLYVMSGLERPSEGHCLFEGVDISTISEERLAEIRLMNIGVVFQFYNLLPMLTVEENIMLPVRLAQKNVNDYAERLQQIINDVGLMDKIKMVPTQLSGGQQQRVAIARALILDPSVIFADEPTGNLDRNNSEEIIKLLYELNKKYQKTVVMVTHNNELLKYTSRVLRISDGQIEGDVSKLQSE